MDLIDNAKVSSAASNGAALRARANGPWTGAVIIGRPLGAFEGDKSVPATDPTAMGRVRLPRGVPQ